MEDALQRLDKLTQEEARMAIAENLKATHTVDERVREVANTVIAIDNRVARASHAIDENVKGVAEQVLAVDDRVAGVDDKVAEVIHGARITFSQSCEMFDFNRSDGKETKQVVDQVKRSSSPQLVGPGYGALRIILETQLRDNIHRWLSPPDPSTNHNIACDTHHKKTATWFFQGNIFRKWKSTPSFLWIHGKRAPFPPSYPIPSDGTLDSSWVRQEYSLVSRCLALSVTRD
jgi:hypothetical protein